MFASVGRVDVEWRLCRRGTGKLRTCVIACLPASLSRRRASLHAMLPLPLPALLACPSHDSFASRLPRHRYAITPTLTQQRWQRTRPSTLPPSLPALPNLHHSPQLQDPAAPRLVSIADGRRASPIKLGSDNPDNLYQNAALEGNITYTILGQRGSVNYLGFGTQSGQYGTAGGLQTVDYIEVSDMEVDEDGSFSLILSLERPVDAPNWLRVAPGKGLFIVRQTFLDRDTEEPAVLTINIGGKPVVPLPFTCERLDSGLASAGLIVAGASLLFAKWARDFQQHTNQLPLFDQEKSNKAGGDPGTTRGVAVCVCVCGDTCDTVVCVGI